MVLNCVYTSLVTCHDTKITTLFIGIYIDLSVYRSLEPWVDHVDASRIIDANSFRVQVELLGRCEVESPSFAEWPQAKTRRRIPHGLLVHFVGISSEDRADLRRLEIHVFVIFASLGLAKWCKTQQKQYPSSLARR